MACLACFPASLRHGLLRIDDPQHSVDSIQTEEDELGRLPFHDEEHSGDSRDEHKVDFPCLHAKSEPTLAGQEASNGCKERAAAMPIQARLWCLSKAAVSLGLLQSFLSLSGQFWHQAARVVFRVSRKHRIMQSNLREQNNDPRAPTCNMWQVHHIDAYAIPWLSTPLRS